MKNVNLFLIDPQVDFCDPSGALYVKGAEKDMLRLADMVRRNKSRINDIHVTLDSHHLVHVAHPIFWRDTKGNHPSPFTIITADDVRNGRWTTTQPSWYRRAKDYVETLETNARYALCIWPPHCLIGTKGQTVFPELNDALQEWCNDLAWVNYITKGSNIFTEHYSAITADVPDPQDPSTQMNVDFLRVINEADIVLLAGEASSHCVATTGKDACNYFADDSFVKKLVYLEDASSPVPGFEQYADEFVRELTSRGMQVAKTTDITL